ncbi:MAG: hypothetical protein ACD_33C00045G0013 [uncultured bacterium]|nr:MAG: hypothetical protein ACD_33C00045G0013 [uncultured bacterium]
MNLTDNIINGALNRVNTEVNELKNKVSSITNDFKDPLTSNLTFKQERNKYSESVDNTFDREWLKSTFILSDKEAGSGGEYRKWIKKNRYVSSADYKFTGTSPGMNLAVNPKPQFTRYSDIRSKGKITERSNITTGSVGSGEYGLGMGRYYSEAIDDNAQRIFLRFGVPKYMSMLAWISKSFDINKTVLQNRGILTSTLLQGVGIVATVFAVAAAPVLALGMFLINAYVESNRFYSVKPTMYLYWATVEDILNSLVTRRSMLPHILSNFSYKLDSKINQEQTINQNTVNKFNELLPGIIDSKGRISVFALALKAQVIFNRIQHSDFENSKDTPLASDFTNYPLSESMVHDTYITNKNGETSLWTARIFSKAYETFVSNDSKINVDVNDKDNFKQTDFIDFDELYLDDKGQPIDLNIDPTKEGDSVNSRINENYKKKKPTWDKYKEYMLAELSEGAAFAIFNVDYTGSIGESFSNSFGANPIESTFNSFSSKARSVTNILSSATDIPVIGDALSLAADAGATILSKASFGLANPLLALAYGVNIEMPKQWESASASLPRASYKMKLISPYGNAYSQLFNIYLPLSMILAGSLPRKTGSSSYTFPFYCQLFDRGRVNVTLGMIDSVSITRGTSNLAFSRTGHPNAIDIDISVANMDNIMSVDVASGGILSQAAGEVASAAKAILTGSVEETPFTDYLNTITGMDVYHQIYQIPKIRLKLAESMLKLNRVIEPDPAAFAAFTVNKMPFENLGKLILGNNVQAISDLTRGL